MISAADWGHATAGENAVAACPYLFSSPFTFPLLFAPPSLLPSSSLTPSRTLRPPFVARRPSNPIGGATRTTGDVSFITLLLEYELILSRSESGFEGTMPSVLACVATDTSIRSVMMISRLAVIGLVVVGEALVSGAVLGIGVMSGWPRCWCWY